MRALRVKEEECKATIPRGCGLPQGVSWTGVVVLGCVAGIGFTMALFLGSLAFSDPGMVAVSKVAILTASLAAGAGGLALGFTRLPRKSANGRSHDLEEETQRSDRAAWHDRPQRGEVVSRR